MTQKLQFSSIGQGKTLVLIHGWGLNANVWQPLAQQLQKHYKVILIDLPGYGNNHDVEVKSYHLANIAQAIVDVVNEPAIYLGWSLGGLVASQIAINFDKTVIEGLVTIASSPCFIQQAGWPGIKPTLLEVFHHQIAKDVATTLNNFLKIQAMGSGHVKDDIKSIQQLVMSAPLPTKQALDSGITLLETSDLRSQFSELTLPILRIYGKMDSLVPKAVIPLIEALSPTSDVVVFNKASHAPFISNSSEFQQTLLDWLIQFDD